MKLLKAINITFLFVFVVLLNVETTWAQPQEETFNFTGGQQSFVVPPNVFQIHIQAWGAQGANATAETTGLGGLGGFAEGDIDVFPGQTLQIFVGGQGTTVQPASSGGGGFNGGGDVMPTNFERGGGGGASDVRLGGLTLNNRVIVAAGGGGACAGEIASGGSGGGSTGGDGGGQPGFGGTQNSGGSAFQGNVLCLDGEFGLGGDDIGGGCGAGGAGWYGGGAGCGGGGGSSYIDGVENGNTISGIREGDGLIVLTFEPMPRNVPTLSEWGLITMAGILGIVGFMVIRRRQATA